MWTSSSFPRMKYYEVPCATSHITTQVVSLQDFNFIHSSQYSFASGYLQQIRDHSTAERSLGKVLLEKKLPLNCNTDLFHVHFCSVLDVLDVLLLFWWYFFHLCWFFFSFVMSLLFNIVILTLNLICFLQYLRSPVPCISIKPLFLPTPWPPSHLCHPPYQCSILYHCYLSCYRLLLYNHPYLGTRLCMG